MTEVELAALTARERARVARRAGCSAARKARLESHSSFKSAQPPREWRPAVEDGEARAEVIGVLGEATGPLERHEIVALARPMDNRGRRIREAVHALRRSLVVEIELPGQSAVFALAERP